MFVKHLNRRLLLTIFAVSILFFQGKLIVLTFSTESLRVVAITEDENEVSLRDANSKRERPRLENFDIDSDTMQEAEVNIKYLRDNSPTKKTLPLTLM